MMKSENLSSRIVMVVFALLALFGVSGVSEAQSAGGTAKTRLAVVGLDHDHVWSLLKDIAGEPSAELVAIAESDAALVSRAQKEVPASVKFYADYVAMLDEAKPEAVIVATANDRHLEILQQFANWLYDPVKNGGGAIMDFGCYGAELSLWLKGRPTRVYATTQKMKVEQNNKVDDDATIVLDYPDATAIIEASWNWPYTKDQVEVFGPKG